MREDPPQGGLHKRGRHVHRTQEEKTRPEGVSSPPFVTFTRICSRTDAKKEKKTSLVMEGQRETLQLLSRLPAGACGACCREPARLVLVLLFAGCLLVKVWE